MRDCLTGLPLEEAEAALCAEGIAYTLRKTETPFRHPDLPDKIYHNYAVRFERGELTYASFPVASYKKDMTDER